MEHRFREDENELPYLLNEKRDHGRPPGSHSKSQKPKSTEEKVNDILISMDVSYSQYIKLKEKVMSFLDARDCTGLTVKEDYGEYDFIFTRENEYIRSTHRFEYFTEFELDCLFSDCYTTHNYDNLLKNPSFQDLIKRLGFEFMGCSGGYQVKTKYFSEFIMMDELDLGVNFKVGSKRRRYKLDLEKMKLSEEYFEYDL
ncbi:hypothetical protein [Methanobrevibacter sp.]|uniref:hypothetical protein n=1 Tax=Methanobrevibacter sp. TaxID=66852 RepID=UPI003869A2DC